MANSVLQWEPVYQCSLSAMSLGKKIYVCNHLRNHVVIMCSPLIRATDEAHGKGGNPQSPWCKYPIYNQDFLLSPCCLMTVVWIPGASRLTFVLVLGQKLQLPFTMIQA